MKERLYFEPDRFAQEPDYYPHGHDAGIPIISAIGRGPKGKSVTAEKQGNTLIIKDEEGNVIATFENLAAPSISVSQDIEEIVAGQDATFDVKVNNADGTTTTTTIIVPCGREGSRIYISSEIIEIHTDGEGNFPYAFADFDKIFFGPYDGIAKQPRVGDVLYSQYSSNNITEIAFGAIAAVGEDGHDVILKILPIFQ